MNKIRNLNEKYWYSPDGQLVFRVSKLNPILMSDDSMKKMENNVIPEQTTGVIQEPVFFRSEPVIATQEVMPTVETPTPMPEEIVQTSVNTSAVPEYSRITIDVPGMDSNLNAVEDPSIAQAIDEEIKEAQNMVQPALEVPQQAAQVSADPELDQKLYNAAEFNAGVAAAKEEVIPETKEIKKDYIVQNIAEIEEFRNKAAEKLMTLKTKVAQLGAELDSLTNEIESFCNETSRGNANAKEYYDTRIKNYENQRQVDNSAMLSTLKSEMNAFNVEAEVQDLGRAA